VIDHPHVLPVDGVGHLLDRVDVVLDEVVHDCAGDVALDVQFLREGVDCLAPGTQT